MNQAPEEIPLSRVKDEIRADAELTHRRAGDVKVVMKRRPRGQTSEPVALRTSYSIAELCESNFTFFLDNAYQALLRRKPDPAGYDVQLRLLVSGRSKVEVLGNLRWSAEGRDIGVHVPGLLPRYLLAKIMSIPVLGYPIEWLASVCSLPRLVRHQRASEVYQNARHQELGVLSQTMARQIEELSIEIGKLKSEHSDAGQKLDQLDIRTGQLGKAHECLESGFVELRHISLSMNHWYSSLRKNLLALETAESEQKQVSDAFHADVARRLLESDALRPARLKLWSERLAGQLPKSAQVLDLCSGADWLSCLLECGLDAAGADTSNEAARQARERGQTIVVAEPGSVLARAADHSLYGLTALDMGFLLRRIPAAELLAEARRVLYTNGWILFGFCSEPSSIADRLAGRPDSAVNGDLMVHALRAAGFADVEQVRTADAHICVLGRAEARP